MRHKTVLVIGVLVALFFFGHTHAQHKVPFVTLYWGQDVTGAEPSLAVVCQQYQAKHINIGFLNNFPTNGNDNLPGLSLAYIHCNETFPGHNLLTCPDVGADIKTCQDLGITVSLSIGGGGGGKFWVLISKRSYNICVHSHKPFLRDLALTRTPTEGNSTTRPFGDVVLDGIDLDIEDQPNTTMS